eukprot:TRINITY_DN1782_c0_g1_i17.p1 TRINITY_DN1782_c0_g1~~TRINITY_DN1782_c0_g1_i17.p1  ORF type:complete len:383 (+),score=43.53 TRINITY_DN1782_c0_g1_i17:173-1321(+)
MHEPSFEVFMSTPHPLGSLYQGVTNLPSVLNDYNELRRYLKEKNITTHTVKEALMMNREKLEKLAFAALTYERNGHFPQETYVGEEYKMQVIKSLTLDHLADIVITQPTITLSPAATNTFVNFDSVRFNPLGNLIFCRDQQITTPKGIVLSKLNSSQRLRETQIMKAVWANLGASVIGEISGNGRLEGGDYFPAKPDLSMLGIGLRTNFEAAHYLMENDLLGHERVALIVDENDYNQDRMHLDTFFNIVSEKEVVSLDFSTVHPKKDLRRKVLLFQKRSTPGDFGSYHLVNRKENLYFEDFLKREGYNVIPITNDEQFAYMINFLNLGKNSLITVNKDLERKLRQYGSSVAVKYIEFDAVKKMYGACHCATQAFRKSPPLSS